MTRVSPAGSWLLLAALLALPLGATLWNGLPRTGVAPPFTLLSTGYEGGHAGPPVPFNLSSYRGHTVVLDLMAVSCTSCRVLTREVLLPLSHTHPDVSLLSIDIWSDPRWGALGETNGSLVALQHLEGATWRHALDTDQVGQKYGVTALPRLVVVDPAGRIVLSRTGTPALASVEAAVAAATAGSARAGARVGGAGVAARARGAR
ncbi:MAG: TlpA family protein disulfide reductase, partial [Thermoplasmatota archaeon]